MREDRNWQFRPCLGVREPLTSTDNRIYISTFWTYMYPIKNPPSISPYEVQETRSKDER